MLVLLAVAAVLIPSLAITAQLPGVDLAVTGIAILGPQPEWIDGVSAAATYKVQATVANRGLVPAAYALTFYWQPSPEGPLSPLSGAPEGANPFPLTGGESRNETFAWSLQDNQIGAGSIVVVIEAQPSSTLDGSPGNNRQSMPIFIPSHQIAFVSSGPAMVVQPGTTGFFRFNATNLGNVHESVDVSIIRAAADSRLKAVMEPARLELAPGSRAVAVLYVRYEPNGNYAPFSVNYDVQASTGFGSILNATSPLLRDGAGNASASEFNVQVTRASTAPVVVPQPSEVHIPFTVTNTGTRPDNYTMTTAIDPRWSARIEPARIGLLPGESATLNARIQQTGSATVGERAELQVTVKPSLSAPRILEIPVVLTGNNLVLQFTEPAPLYRGQESPLDIQVTNQESTAIAGATVELAIIRGTTIESARPQTIDSLPPESTTAKTFQIPAPAAGGNHTLQVTVKLADGSPSDVMRLTTFVHDPAITIVPPSPKGGKPGENVTYSGTQTFLVTNQGNAPEEIRVNVVVGHGTVKVDGQESFQLKPSESRRVNIIQRLPHPSMGLDAVNASFTASIAGTPMQWTADVATAITDASSPTVTLRHPLPAKWTFGRELMVNFTIRDEDLIRAANVTILDASGSRTIVPLNVVAGQAQFPFSPDTPGRYVLGAKAVDAHGNVGKSPDLKVEVVAANPVIRLANFQAGAVNASDWLRVEVQDIYGVSQVNLTLVQGERSFSRLMVLTWGGAGFDLKELSNGTATIVVAAENLFGGRTETRINVEVQNSTVSGLAAASQDLQSKDAPLTIALIAPLIAAWIANRSRRPRGLMP